MNKDEEREGRDVWKNIETYIFTPIYENKVKV